MREYQRNPKRYADIFRLMRLSGHTFAFLFTAALLTIYLRGQEAPTIRATVPLVTLPVSVADRRGGFIYDLNSSDFLLLDDGKARPVRVDIVDPGLAPIALVALV